MSGGSYNYLFLQDPTDYPSFDLEEMIEDVQYTAKEKGIDVEPFLLNLKQLRDIVANYREDFADKMQEVSAPMRAWEWYMSNDIGLDGFLKSMEDTHV